jgi:hypothetical protein
MRENSRELIGLAKLFICVSSMYAWLCYVSLYAKNWGYMELTNKKKKHSWPLKFIGEFKKAVNIHKSIFCDFCSWPYLHNPFLSFHEYCWRVKVKRWWRPREGWGLRHGYKPAPISSFSSAIPQAHTLTAGLISHKSMHFNNRLAFCALYIFLFKHCHKESTFWWCTTG